MRSSLVGWLQRDNFFLYDLNDSLLTARRTGKRTEDLTRADKKTFGPTAFDA